jgi:hypothetical protein
MLALTFHRAAITTTVSSIWRIRTLSAIFYREGSALFKGRAAAAL